jgi:hypothetical protein
VLSEMGRTKPTISLQWGLATIGIVAQLCVRCQYKTYYL